MDDISSPDLPKNKILIAFGNSNSSYQKNVVSQLFGIDIDHGDRIVKKLQWKTKYYKVEFDLYIDEYDDFSSWFQEFTSPEFSALREVLAGLIIVDQYNSTTQLNALGIEDSFAVWINTDGKVDQEQVDELNQELCQINQNSVEMINLCADKDTNEYGEKIGTARLKEILDTCTWKNCNIDYLATTSSSVNAPTHPVNPELSLESLIQKMQNARLKHTNSEMDNDEAMQIAQEIAEELMGNED